MKRTLRVHHLLCIPLFQGKGYSDRFCENMTEKIQWLKDHEEEEILLVCGPDMICRECPNLIEGNYCTDKGNYVLQKDRRLLQALGLEEGTYSFAWLLAYIQEKITEDIFDDSCKNCQWYQQGLCSYAQYQRKIMDFVQ